MRSNANNSALIEMISSDILTYSIFPFLVDNPKELVEYMLVSRGFHQAADHPSVWKALAIRRYGETITQATEQAIQERQLYTSLKEAILKDDNVQLAIPTIREPKACDWAFNRHDSLHWHYCCIVQGIKWIRSSDFLYVYLDVRGESDLRPPGHSRITSSAGSIYTAPPVSWHSALPNPRAGQFKGYLAVPTGFFNANTSYFFQYSARFAGDYKRIDLFTLPCNGLKGLFGIPATTPSFTLKADDDSIFEVEDAAKEQRRWEAFVPVVVLDRRRGEPGAWWVEEPEDPSEDSSVDSSVF